MFCQRFEPGNVGMSSVGPDTDPRTTEPSWAEPESAVCQQETAILCWRRSSRVPGARRLQPSGLNLPSDQRVWCVWYLLLGQETLISLLAFKHAGFVSGHGADLAEAPSRGAGVLCTVIHLQVLTGPTSRLQRSGHQPSCVSPLSADLTHAHTHTCMCAGLHTARALVHRSTAR